MKLEVGVYCELLEQPKINEPDTYGPGDDEFSLMTLELMMKTLMVSKLNSTLYIPFFLNIVLQFGF